MSDDDWGMADDVPKKEVEKLNELVTADPPKE
jgi:hypothetical protein